MKAIRTADSILKGAAAKVAAMQGTTGGVIRTTCFVSRTLLFLGTGQNYDTTKQCQH